MCRYLKGTQQKSRTMASGWGTRAELGTTTCTRNTGTPHSMVPSNKCTTRWHPVTVSGFLASRLSRQPPSLRSCANAKTPSSFMTQRSSSHLSTGRSGLQQENSRPLSRLPDQISSCRRDYYKSSRLFRFILAPGSDGFEVFCFFCNFALLGVIFIVEPCKLILLWCFLYLCMSWIIFMMLTLPLKNNPMNHFIILLLCFHYHFYVLGALQQVVYFEV